MTKKMKSLFFFLLILVACSKSQLPNIHINGSGATTGINNGQPRNVTVNAQQYFAPVTGDITFTDSHFQFSIPGYAKTNFTARSTAGYVEFRTSVTSIDIKIGGDWVVANVQSDCEILVDGVYNQSVRLTAADVTQTYTITLPAGEKIVRLVNGYTANPTSGDITLPNTGVYIQGVVTAGPIEIKIPTTVVHKKLFIGNSITTGASADHPSITGFLGLFRSQNNWEVQADSWGARRLLTTTQALGEEMAEFVSDEMNGTASNECFVLLGTNNFGLSGGQSKAVFKSEYQHFLDELHTLRSDIIIYCVSPLDRTTYSTPNSQGATLEDYSDAIQELIGDGRSWAKFIYGKTLVSLANMPDGLHPNQTGHQQYHDNLLSAYNLLAYVPRQKPNYAKGMYVNKSGELNYVKQKRGKLKYSK